MTSTAFDFNSIMMFGEYAFAKSPAARTMQDKTGKHRLVEPYEKSGMTPDDAYEVKQRYSCQ